MDTGKHPAEDRMVPKAELSTPNISSAEVDKPCFKPVDFYSINNNFMCK